jgi:CheY-like chemotaxis protein
MDRSPLPPLLRAKPTGSGGILVVDDDQDAAESLAVLVHLWGYPVHVALNGPQAVAAVRAHRPALVLLDLGLPGMDGYEVVRRILEVTGEQDAPVLVALTGYGPDSDPRSGTVGFRAYLLKPVPLDELRDLLSRSLAPALG